MKQYVVNKNITYGKTVYAKDAEILESDVGFKDLLAAGHAVEIAGSGAPKKMAAEVPPEYRDEEPVKEKVVLKKGRKN